MKAYVVRELYAEFAKESTLIDDSNYKIVAKLAVILKMFLERRRDRLVESAAGGPIVYSYQSDATSYLSRAMAAGACDGQSTAWYRA